MSGGDLAKGLPSPDNRHGEPEPATVEELAEALARTEAEQAALDALAGDPDGQSLELLKQHLRHATTPPDGSGKQGRR